MLSLNQLVNKMKNETLYFKSVYSINRFSFNFKEIDYGIKFIYREKDFILVKPSDETNCYILQGNFIVGKVDLAHSENFIISDITRELDSILDNPFTARIKVIKPNIDIFQKVNFGDIFIKLGKNKINMVKIINAK